ncbi:hypothetical protein [Mesorhizobium sp. M2A.F.Ca.ET.039.01.1.1]|uniref:capsular polysaccharide export protein, LipB/KpsS family n=1 Tax=Mesorhizobium sp. M2A.F.Ca.ET.039.01.1.1 TaxID=2496746 RepID=UPI00167B8D96|nr:hypothetical protein [Mesorhizobium sp. M2A.F.Ca.ET.039.01.1.1]
MTVADAAASPCSILLLGGPVGPFFANLARVLVRRGFVVERCLFNPGDGLFGLGDALALSPEDVGRQLEAPPWQAAVVFGVDRSRHKVLFDALRARNVPVLCLEEGYIRPGFVACEWNGSHHHSPLRLRPDAQKRDCRDRSDVTEPDEGRCHGLRQSLFAIAQVVWLLALIPILGGTWHRERRLAGEALYWPLGWMRRALHKCSDARILKELVEAGMPYRVVALQVHDDANLVANGQGWHVKTMIKELLEAFSHYAPPEEHLLFKIHPLDAGHLDHRAIVAEAIGGRVIAKRVHVVCDVPLGVAVKASCGLITVNSTSGLSGLHHGVQTDVLGLAFYEGNGLARHCSDLGMIWTTPHSPDPRTVATLKMRIYAHAVIPGSFYGAGAIERLAWRVANRLVTGMPQPSIIDTKTSNPDCIHYCSEIAFHSDISESSSSI